MVKIHINGERKELDAELSVLDLLAKLEIDYRTVAIEVSEAVIPRTKFGETKVGDGDRVEIVRFVQGG